VFVDETGSNIAMAPRVGRAPRGERLYASIPRNHGANTTLLSSLSVDGMGPSLLVAGATTTEVFAAYVSQVLVPWLRPGQIVVLDNLSVHKSTRVRSWIEAAGCQLRFLPAYSPDFSPIEWAFSKLKIWLRQAQARTVNELERAVAAGMMRISRADAQGWFYGCGYLPLEQPL
jgi:transposase